jgi:hypothetical protein
MQGLRCKSFFQDLDETTNLKSKSTTTNNYIVRIDRNYDLNRNRNIKISIQFEPISAKPEISKDTKNETESKTEMHTETEISVETEISDEPDTDTETESF